MALTANNDDIDREIHEVLIQKLVNNGKLSLKNSAKCVNNNECAEKLPKIKSINLKKLGEDGTFMLSYCNKVQVMLVNDSEDSDCNHETVYNLVIKYTPTVDEDVYNLAQFDSLFSNEIAAYEYILPEFGKNLTVCQYFYSYNIPKTRACVVLEDFGSLGFQMSKELVNLPLDHLFAAVSELGRFHGEGYVLKATNLEKFNKIISYFKESRYATNTAGPSWTFILNRTPERAIKSARKYKYPIPEEFINKFKQLFINTYHFQRSSVIPEEPLAVICHGDYLRNNIAFSYEKDEQGNDHPSKVLIFDYQTLRYASPMIDLSVFMCCSVGFKERNGHFDELFDAYFEGIKQTFTKHSTELPDFITRENLLMDYIKYLSYGFSVAASFIWLLHEPDPPVSLDEMLDTEENMQEALNILMTRGGEVLDIELAQMLQHLYDLSEKYKIDVCTNK